MFFLGVGTALCNDKGKDLSQGNKYRQNTILQDYVKVRFRMYLMASKSYTSFRLGGFYLGARGERRMVTKKSQLPTYQCLIDKLKNGLH